jgi:hypothetical protein
MNFFEVGPNPEMTIWSAGVRNIKATITTPTTIKTIPNVLLDIRFSSCNDDNEIGLFFALIVPKTTLPYGYWKADLEGSKPIVARAT